MKKKKQAANKPKPKNLLEHLEYSSKVVASWPNWKKEALGITANSSQPIVAQ